MAKKAMTAAKNFEREDHSQKIEVKLPPPSNQYPEGYHIRLIRAPYADNAYDVIMEFYPNETLERRGKKFSVYNNATDFCIKILEMIGSTRFLVEGSKYGFRPYLNLRDYAIKLLEEKFGLKVKTCGNCKFAGGARRHGVDGLICYRGIQGHPYEDLQEDKNNSLLSFKDTCEHWTPKPKEN